MDEAHRQLLRGLLDDPGLAPRALRSLAQRSAPLARALEAGVEFAWIPPGEYPVGLDAAALPSLHAYETSGRPASYTPAICKPRGRAAIPGLFLSVEPLRRSLWGRLGLDPTLLSSIDPDDPDPDPAVELPIEDAVATAEVLGAGLPRWDEWEAGTRGPAGLLFPWGTTPDFGAMSLERYSYERPYESIEGTGQGAYDGDVVVSLVRSFGPLAEVASPCGLRGLARAGREWNTSASTPGGIVRSLSNLSDVDRGQEAVPGSVVRRVFSGPTLANYLSSYPYAPRLAAMRLALRPFGEPKAPATKPAARAADEGLWSRFTSWLRG